MNLIVAVSANGVIGNAGKIPWRCKEDMAHFKRTTTGHAVIMGRKTWDSLPPKMRPLPERWNIVLTRHPETLDLVNKMFCATSLDDALERAADFDHEPFIIGGADIYRLAMPLVTRAFVTVIREEHEGDARFSFFHEAPAPSEWESTRLWETEQACCMRWDRVQP